MEDLSKIIQYKINKKTTYECHLKIKFKFRIDMYNYKKVNICYDLIEKSSDLFEKFSINVQHFQLRKTLKSISFFF